MGYTHIIYIYMHTYYIHIICVCIWNIWGDEAFPLLYHVKNVINCKKRRESWRSSLVKGDEWELGSFRTVRHTIGKPSYFWVINALAACLAPLTHNKLEISLVVGNYCIITLGKDGTGLQSNNPTTRAIVPLPGVEKIPRLSALTCCGTSDKNCPVWQGVSIEINRYVHRLSLWLLYTYYCMRLITLSPHYQHHL